VLRAVVDIYEKTAKCVTGACEIEAATGLGEDTVQSGGGRKFTHTGAAAVREVVARDAGALCQNQAARQVVPQHVFELRELCPLSEKGARLKVYLAGPDVFFPNPQEVGLKKKSICAEYGFEGLFPLDNEISASNLGKSETAQAIFEANCDLMDTADFIIANMMPFRGVSTDAGTAFEVGYMYAQGKPVFGYGADGLAYLERVIKADLGGEIGTPNDRQGMHIEDFGLTDNLMLVCAVRRYGHDVINSQGEWSDLSAFRKCVRLAAERLPLLRGGPS